MSHYTPLILVVSFALVASSTGAPIFDDLFAGLFARRSNANTDSQTSPEKDSHLVKRHFVEENRDATGAKEISLQSLIGDLESSLYQSAASVSRVAHDKGAVVPEVTPPVSAAAPAASTDAHIVTKRHTAVAEEVEKSTTELGPITTNPAADVASTTAEPQPDARKIVLQTTEKVPEKNGVPAHILIDRVSVQEHNGGVALLPTFHVQHTKLITASVSEQGDAEGGPSKKQTITITKTDIKASNVPAAETVEKPEAVSESKDSISTVVPETSESSTASSASTTTPKKEQLKEAEAELKEKVAEIEAEPVILTARV